MNTYTYVFYKNCPNNGLSIKYKLKIVSSKTIMVEKIIETIEAYGLSIFHEHLADKLEPEIGGLQTLSAHHHGVDIETKRGAI